MTITLKTLIVTGALLVAGVASVSATTINQPAHVPATTGLIPVATGSTANYPNVTPQTASGNLQVSNYPVQVTATTTDQYLLR